MSNRKELIRLYLEQNKDYFCCNKIIFNTFAEQYITNLTFKTMTNTENILYITVCELENIISKWKMRAGVLSGYDLAWKPQGSTPKEKNTPNSLADGLSTTGWCVSASQCLLDDNIFQLYLEHNKANAKLVSIDLKEQHWGSCFNGRGNTQGGAFNKWHTAIYMEIHGHALIIDVTCAQFGNSFIGKDIWDFKSWQTSFRSALCKHSITDFQNNSHLITPILNDSNINSIKTLDEVMLKYNLKNISNLKDSERDLLVDFLFKRLSTINNNILLKNVNSYDYSYLKKVNDILEHLPIKVLKIGYSVLAFSSKDSAKNWLSLVMENNTLPCYLQVSSSVSDSCLLNNININDLNCDTLNDMEKTFIVFEFENLLGIETDFIKFTELLLPIGSELQISKRNISNISLVSGEVQKLNTITVKV